MKDISLVSWNVNGIRAAEKKGFLEFLEQGKYDMVAVQETKTHDHTILSDKLLHPDGYTAYFHGATEKKGYSGVAIYTKLVPNKVKTDFGAKSLLSKEGRVLELHFTDFVLLNIYFPNGGASSDRLKYKLKFYQEFLAYLKDLQQKHSKIIFCGDVNTAHYEIDLARPKENVKTSGFLLEERVWLDKFEDLGFVDSFRVKHPETVKYSWWDQKTGARARNVGWRIDYFYLTKNLQAKIKTVDILTDIYGSDHAPVLLKLSL